MKTLVKIVFNKKFNHFEALTAAADKDGIKIQKFGNDYNIFASTEEEVKNKVLHYVQNNVIDNNLTFINNH